MESWYFVKGGWYKCHILFFSLLRKLNSFVHYLIFIFDQGILCGLIFIVIHSFM